MLMLLSSWGNCFLFKYWVRIGCGGLLILFKISWNGNYLEVCSICYKLLVFNINFFYTLFQPDYKAIAKSCNIWRNYNDIQDSWESVASIIKFYGDNKLEFAEVAKPGQFNDPDMVNYFDISLLEIVLYSWIYII